ncbi:MAG: hypothetical protein F4228_12585 [Acidobacteria bacterium]|nr:hypothetical protein [Acidobacteriota bacterium]MYF15526.1 hypothetical protein [Acidobacteriota bacterium]MYI96576.1 hypothetical protein [Acidobacteriota bacterium]
MRRPLALLVGLPGVFWWGCLPGLDETSVETIRRPGAPALVVRVDRGSVIVREHLGAEFEIEVWRTAQAPSREAAQAVLKALVVDLERDPVSGALTVTGRRATAGTFRPWEELALSLRIAVPPGTAVDARTGSGRIELEGLTGPVRATSASGRIAANDLRSPEGTAPEPIRLRTADGRIAAQGLEGSVRAESGEGRIELEGRLRQVTAVTADGRIEVDVRGGGPRPAGEWFLGTGSGPVRLTLPRITDAVVTAVGSPDSDDRRDVSDWQREGPLALATLGDGSGPRIHLRTGDGSVRVRVADRN